MNATVSGGFLILQYLSKDSVTFHALSQLKKTNILKIKQEAHKLNSYLSTLPTTQTSQICI